MVKRFEIAPGVTQFQSDAALVNCVVVDGGEELLVVDTLLRPRDTREVAAFIAETGKPVRWLVNTHWHSDHCYGNRFLADAQTCIVAHRDHMQTLSRERYVLSPGRKSIVERDNLVHPHFTITRETSVVRPVKARLIPSPGHTPDSIVIYLPEMRLLITGDTVLNSGDGRIAVPYFYWGDSADYLVTLENLLTLDVERVIPGHGAVCGREVIERGVEYLRAARRLTDEFFASHDFDWNGYEMENSGILASHCLPGATEDDFWAPQMHGLNLQRRLMEYTGKDIE